MSYYLILIELTLVLSIIVIGRKDQGLFDLEKHCAQLCALSERSKKLWVERMR